MSITFWDILVIAGAVYKSFCKTIEDILMYEESIYQKAQAYGPHQTCPGNSLESCHSIVKRDIPIKELLPQHLASDDHSEGHKGQWYVADKSKRNTAHKSRHQIQRFLIHFVSQQTLHKLG